MPPAIAPMGAENFCVSIGRGVLVEEIAVEIDEGANCEEDELGVSSNLEGGLYEIIAKCG
jgi:hypothetical protein